MAEDCIEKEEENEFILDYYSEERENINAGNFRKQYKCRVCFKEFRHSHWWVQCEAMHKLKEIDKSGDNRSVRKCSGCGVKLFTDFHFVKHLQTCKLRFTSEAGSARNKLLEFLNDETQKMDEAEKQKMDDVGKQKMDKAEKQKMDEAEKQKMDEAEKQKMDEAEKEKMDEEEKQKMDEAEKQKMDEAEKQKMDEAEKEKMDEEEKQKMDEAEKQKMDEAEKQKMDEAEKQKMDEAEKQKMGEAEKQKMDEAEKQKMDEAEEQKMDEAEKQKMDEVEKQKMDEVEHMNVKKHICSACGAECYTDFIFMVHLEKCMNWKMAEASSTRNKEVEFLNKMHQAEYENNKRQCGDCGAQFSTEATYKTHLENCDKMQSKPIIHACSGCGAEYSNDLVFEMHLMKCIKWIMAEASSTRNKEVEFLKKMHKAEFEKNERKCGGCGALFFTSFTYKNHLENCKKMHSLYKKPIFIHSCSGCGVGYSNDLSFMKHLEKCKIWMISEDSSIKKEEMEFLSKMHKAEYMYNKNMCKCSGCGQEYFSNMTFAQHLQICNIWMMAEASSIKNTEEQFLKKMEGALKRKSVASEKVSKTFKQHSDRVQVLEIDKHHTDKVLTTKTNKRGSDRVQATEADKLSCSGCGQEFLYDWLYAIHLIRCSKWTEAEDSDAKFEENDFLKKIYKRENAVQMLYKCRGCGLECASYQTLVTHFSTCKEWKGFGISEDEIERIALESVINVCGTSTVSGKVNVCQEKIEPNYKCRYCSKKFKIKDYWRACESSHKATSNIEVACHQCSGCGREFITDWTFVRHLYYCEKWKMAEPSSAKDEEQFILELSTMEDGSGTSLAEDKMSDHDDESDEISPNGGINQIFDDVVSDSDDEDLGQIPCTTGDQSIDFTDLTRKNLADSWIPMRRKFRKEMIMVTKHPSGQIEIKQNDRQACDENSQEPSKEVSGNINTDQSDEEGGDSSCGMIELVSQNDTAGIDVVMYPEQNDTQGCDENVQEPSKEVSGNINPEQSDEGGDSSYGMIELESQNDTAGIDVVMYPEQNDTQGCDENVQEPSKEVSGNINPEQSDEEGGDSSCGMIELVSQNDTAGIEVVMYPEQIDTNNRITDKMEAGGFFDQIEFM
ncbi:uncharacterized protein [Amphiura filiformis]|uniref:uncharacterized protein n=1 Tax=Amphiura filiformis TaxID=82378 RepID=UPI003B210CED